MLIKEILREDSDINAQLIPILSYIKRSCNQKSSNVVSIAAVTRFIQNQTGIEYSANDLRDAFDNNDGVKNLISNITGDDKVQFKSDDDDDTEDMDVEQGQSQNPQDVVSNMAKKAANSRS
jgi:hypothetical protein